MMKITDRIVLKIGRLPKGYIFTYSDFITEVDGREAVIKALNRMVNSGRISKLSKGKYYKPEVTPFGNILPAQKEVVKDLLEENGKLIGYLSGYSIYNKLVLTSQISNTIQIGRNQIRPSFKRDRYTISFIRQRNTITKDNIPLLQILDSIRYIKSIPDITIENSCRRFLVILEELSDKDKIALARLALKYPPSTRALLGSLYDDLRLNTLTIKLYDSLNPITIYKIEGANKVLQSHLKWNIV